MKYRFYSKICAVFFTLVLLLISFLPIACGGESAGGVEGDSAGVKNLALPPAMLGSWRMDIEKLKRNPEFQTALRKNPRLENLLRAIKDMRVTFTPDLMTVNANISKFTAAYKVFTRTADTAKIEFQKNNRTRIIQLGLPSPDQLVWREGNDTPLTYTRIK